MEGVTIAPLAADALDALRPLWLALHARHREVSPVPLVADDEASWLARRALYARRLARGDAFCLVASSDGDAVGYAFCFVEDGPDDSFPVGERYGELYSLSVAEDQRGHGIGTRLLDEVDAELSRRGISDLAISVFAGNDDARRLYERRGFRVAEHVLWRLGAGGSGGGDTM
jgi:ribosomal protein S18 acetylase RimI-like enzyme